GERRYRASLLAGLDDIPALIRHLDTRQVLEVQVIENLQRRGVNELDTKMAGNVRQDRLVERIATMTGAELCALLLDCALVDTLHVSSWADNLATPDPLLETAQAYGVDHESIRANLAAAAAAKKTASPPTKAPRGGDSKPVKKSKPVAKAAPAPGSTGKATPKKTKTSGRVTAAGGNETPTDPPAHRCPNTPDMLEGVVT
ncbi:MAG TPA: ParB N-terminal domain-containing protein, partial [Rhodocyclaceae bacterium]|nr:ParB N-terminal domain-containing protein [Rhodocyclaceae bacterium]